MALSILPDDIFSILPITPDTKNIWVGFSGGLDSHVLLHLLSLHKPHLRPKIVAIHINHGLNERADEWSAHCKKVCNDLGLEFRLVTVNAKAPSGESPEAWARLVRYNAMRDVVEEDDILLTAHHKDDMAETLLIQLLRGSGPAGLSAMPQVVRFGNGWHCRPLLAYNRQELHQLADECGLSWIEDDSNQDRKFDRNYLRHNVIPVIKDRWPSMTQTLSRAAGIQAESSFLLGELARIDLAECKHQQTGALKVTVLNSFSRARAANVIRYWIKLQGLSTPTASQLHRIINDVLNSKVDAEPCVEWEGIQLRRYRNSIFITQSLPDKSSKQGEGRWQLNSECRLIMGSLSAKRGKGNGIKVGKCPDNGVIIKYRHGSELIKKGGHHHSLKSLYQESGVPSCFRDYIPLIYIGEHLVAISGLHIDDDYAATPDEDAIQIHWSEAAEVFALSVS